MIDIDCAFVCITVIVIIHSDDEIVIIITINIPGALCLTPEKPVSV